MAERLEIVISATDRASGVLNTVGLAIAKQKAHLEGLNVVSQQFTNMGRQQMIAAAGIAAGLAAIARPAATFEQAMRNVNSIVKGSESEYQGMRRAVLDIARDKMITDMPEVLARGLYDIESSGLAGQAAMDTLKIAAKGGAAGLSDTATAARVLTAVMNAYDTKTGPDAQHIMDVLFKTVDRGVVTFGELAQNFSFASTTAAAAGVPLADVAAGMMTMTKQGHDAAISSTALQRIITSFLNPQDKFNKLIHQAGYESGLQILHTKGLAGAVEWLTQATGGQQDVLVEMFGEQRAVRAAFALTGKGAQMYADDLKAANNAQGAYAAAAAEQAKGPMFQWTEAVKQLKIAVVEMGPAVLPIMGQVTDAVRSISKWLQSLSDEQKKGFANKALWAAGGLAGLGAMNLIIGGGLRLLVNLDAIVKGLNAVRAAAIAAAAAEAGAAGGGAAAAAAGVGGTAAAGAGAAGAAAGLGIVGAVAAGAYGQGVTISEARKSSGLEKVGLYASLFNPLAGVNAGLLRRGLHKLMPDEADRLKAAGIDVEAETRAGRERRKAARQTVMTPAAAAAGYGPGTTMTFYANDREEMKRQACEQIDRAFPK